MIYCANIVFATMLITPKQTSLTNLVTKSWWKRKVCRLTLLHKHPLHAFAQNKKKYHQPASASVFNPSAPLGLGLGLGLGLYTLLRL